MDRKDVRRQEIIEATYYRGSRSTLAWNPQAFGGCMSLNLPTLTETSRTQRYPEV